MGCGANLLVGGKRTSGFRKTKFQVLGGMRAADEDSESEEEESIIAENKRLLNSTYLECGAADSSMGLFGSSTPKTSSADHLFVFAGSHKAGMTSQGAEELMQKKIIQDASKGSAYHDRAERADEKADERIAAMQEKLKAFTMTELNMAKRDLDTNLAALEKHRSFERQIVCMDMDAFYANVELRDRPELKHLPVAVGDGIITTSNYVARKFGVRAAMPGFIAKKLCPELIFLPCEYLSIYLSHCLSMYIYMYVSVCLPVCLSI